MEFKPEPDDISSVESGNDLTVLIKRLQLQAQELDSKFRKSQSKKAKTLNDSGFSQKNSSVLSNEEGSESQVQEDDYLESDEGNRSLHYLLGAIHHLSTQFDILTNEMRRDRVEMDKVRAKIESAEQYRDLLSENQNSLLEIRTRQLQDYYETATARMKKIEDAMKTISAQPKQVTFATGTPVPAQRTETATLTTGSSNKVTVSGNSVVHVTPSINVNPSQTPANQRTVAQYSGPVSISCVLASGNVINASGNSNVTLAPVVNINVPTSSFSITATVDPDGTTRAIVTPISQETALAVPLNSMQHSFVSHAPITISGNGSARRG